MPSSPRRKRRRVRARAASALERRASRRLKHSIRKRFKRTMTRPKRSHCRPQWMGRLFKPLGKTPKNIAATPGHGPVGPRIRRSKRYGKSSRSSAETSSLRLDVGRPDHLGPLVGLLGDEPAEVGGRTRKHSATKVGKARLHLGIVERRVDLLVELVDDLGGRVLGRANAEPCTCLVARQGFA